jgi:hypothetical protein
MVDADAGQSKFLTERCVEAHLFVVTTILAGF